MTTGLHVRLVENIFHACSFVAQPMTHPLRPRYLRARVLCARLVQPLPLKLVCSWGECEAPSVSVDYTRGTTGSSSAHFIS